jgi:UDP-N-acetylmuramoyl-L-alanyl-D-glutamate--2,6-diaminopimelate ligase
MIELANSSLLRPAASAGGTALGELAAAIGGDTRVVGDGSVRVSDVRQDSRDVRRGDLFVARSGGRTNGVIFVEQAIARGAAAVLVERGTGLGALSVPVVEVEDARRASAFAAEIVHHAPSSALRVVGITGTNGKTTTSFLVEHALAGAGQRPARLGTLGWSFGADTSDSPLTTPEADVISRYAARARDGGGSHLVMEVSSHALEQQRVDAVRFAVAAFTNLTQDHLDYHGSMQQYGRAKLRLFAELEPAAAVVNMDDPFAHEITRACRAPLLGVSRSGSADVRPLDVAVDPAGIRGLVQLPSGAVELSSRLVGHHNLDNLLLCLGIVEVLGLSAARAAEALSRAPAVPGRLERCDVPVDDILVLVDYAHTPDALRRALEAVRSLTSGQSICVFGCGGDRDPEKRPKMGEAVGRAADHAILTTDNPRSEDPAAIADAVERGLERAGTSYEVELDRATAIERAVLNAAPGDVVLIAGKGHEPYQIVGQEQRRFDDRVQARRALALRRERLGR